jgi:hypothetical protein
MHLLSYYAFYVSDSSHPPRFPYLSEIWCRILCKFLHHPVVLPPSQVQRFPAPCFKSVLSKGQEPTHIHICIYVWGSGGVATPFLTSALDGDEWSTLRPGRFTPGETAFGTHWVGGWVDPRGGLDAMEKRNNFPIIVIESWPSGT